MLCLLGATASGVAAAAPPDQSRHHGTVTADETSTSVDALGNETGITRTSLSGFGIAVRENDTVYVWQNGSLDLEVTMVPFDKSGEHRICLDVLNDEGTVVANQGCRNVDVQDHGSRTIFEVETLSTNGTGPHDLAVTLEDFDDNETVRIPVVVVTQDGDLDSDSLNNSQEVALGTGIDDSDTDGDGLLDGNEVTKHGTDPTRKDSDGDGLNDGREINLGTEPTEKDTDGDGLTDGEEVNEYDTDPLERDTDEDGLDDPRELELGTDPRDEDTDNDGVDDGTEVERGSDPLATDTPRASPSDEPSRLSNEDTMLVIGVGTIVAGLMIAAGYVRMRDGPDSSAPGDAAAAGATEDDAVDTELLSPEQHVMYLLETNGGQMKQNQFVEETGWSKAKVSRKLSQLEEEGEIKRVRIGRENVVTYPDRDLGDET